MPHATANDFCLLLGHADQHLELHAILNAAVFSQKQRKRNVKEVVPGNTQADVLSMLGAQRVI